MKPKWRTALDDLLNQVISNPNTTLAGIATILAAFFPTHGVKIALVFAGLGHILSKDGNQGGTLPPPEVDKAVKTVEQKL